MHPRRGIVRRTTLSLALVAGACAESAAPGPGSTGVLLQPERASASAGHPFTLQVTDSSGVPLPDERIEWSTSDTTVAIVSAGGRVTPLGEGAATITATVSAPGGDASSSSAITVLPPSAAALVIAPSEAGARADTRIRLAAVAHGDTASPLSPRDVAWISNDAAVATVSGDGIVTAVAAGTATITATSAGERATAAITVIGAAAEPPPSGASGAAWYVSPAGSSGGDGSRGRPWSLDFALGGADGAIRPGDTVWLEGGTYEGAFTSTLAGASARPIVVRQLPGERATIDGHLVIQGRYTWFRDLEVTTSEAAPDNVMGVDIRAPGVKAIDMIVHDNGGNGFGVWSDAPDAEVYGSLVYDNGRQRATPGYAHGIYAQNDRGSKLFRDNVVFHQFGYGFHIYGEDGAVRSMTFDGNVSFQNGVGTTGGDEAQPDYLFGGLMPVRDLAITSNMTWHAEYGGGSVWVGYAACECTGTRVALRNNYFVGGAPVLRLERLGGLRVTGNTLVGSGLPASLIEETGGASDLSWGGNTYYGNSAAPEFQWDGAAYDFAGWRAATSVGAGDRHAGDRPPGAEVFVRPNRYERGRANVIIYNWARAGAVPVDLSKVLDRGERYEIRNVQDWFGAPVASGTYDGGMVPFPMAGVTPAEPRGGWVRAPIVTGPDFNVFVVLRK
ncbi:MAG TPA: Ig-like domain-containing protein [Gemmatimonadaceae bacterium]